MIQAINIATQKCGSKMRFHTFELLPQNVTTMVTVANIVILDGRTACLA